MAETKECLRCKRLGRPHLLPISQFYRDVSGKPLATCKKCRRELSSKYYRQAKSENRASSVKERDPGKFEVPEATGTLVTIEEPAGPTLAVWRCASCFAKATTRASGQKSPPFPASWRNIMLDLRGGKATAILCGPCSTILLRARRVLDRIQIRMEAESREIAERNDLH